MPDGHDFRPTAPAVPQQRAKSRSCSSGQEHGLSAFDDRAGRSFRYLFKDGKIDVMNNALDDVPVLLRNVSPDKNHWVGLKLIGGPNSPRAAVGRRRLSDSRRYAPALRHVKWWKIFVVE